MVASGSIPGGHARPVRFSQTARAPIDWGATTSLSRSSPTDTSSVGWQPAAAAAIWNRRGSGLRRPT